MKQTVVKALVEAAHNLLKVGIHFDHEEGYGDLVVELADMRKRVLDIANKIQNNEL